MTRRADKWITPAVGLALAIVLAIVEYIRNSSLVEAIGMASILAVYSLALLLLQARSETASLLLDCPSTSAGRRSTSAPLRPPAEKWPWSSSPLSSWSKIRVWGRHAVCVAGSSCRDLFLGSVAWLRWGARDPADRVSGPQAVLPSCRSVLSSATARQICSGEAMSLIIDSVSKRFGEVLALDDVSLGIKPGEVFGFLGANGAGKTTAMRIVLDILRPDSGTITWNGNAEHRAAERDLGLPARGTRPLRQDERSSTSSSSSPSCTA